MLDKNEIREIAKVKAMKPWQQEKHYLLAVMLGVLSEQPLVFKGGTYLWFFHGLSRFSEDLDFSAIGNLHEKLPETVSKSLRLFGIENSLKIIADNSTSLSFRISAKGPLNTTQRDECRVYVEISRREAVEKKALPLKIEFPEYNLPVKRGQGMALEEIGAEKVRAVMTREKARDLYDLHYLIARKNIAFDMELIDSKLNYYNKKFTKKKFLESAKDKRKYYAKELGNLIFDELGGFETAINSIQDWVG